MSERARGAGGKRGWKKKKKKRAGEGEGEEGGREGVSVESGGWGGNADNAEKVPLVLQKKIRSRNGS